ncbi:MAG: B12-binding domain-containing radical SAM protein [Myxococcales bacterium]|nr:B12-binding domain-containing radical SAM protein [Myxococcales bacterium]
MRVSIVGADFEENLGVGMIAAAAEAAGHRVDIVPFAHPREVGRIARRIADAAPDVVGLSMQFQHRAYEFLQLARALRAVGFDGHITCGGQYPTLAWSEVLEQNEAVDSVVLHEGEHSFPELLDALSARRTLDDVAGLALRGPGGQALRTTGRALTHDLDALPFARRYRAHNRHVGVPFIPIMGSRGCWGSCAYCSITTFYRDARDYGGAKLLRHRSAENVAAEMALLWHQCGGRAVFCFHDDNFLLPKPDASLARLQEIRRWLDSYGVGEVAMIGKCRPECITPELAKAMRELGVIRVYVGIENVSEGGSLHLGRGKQTQHVDAALDACREANIFGCYNLLIFEPDATLDDVADNIAFIRRHPGHPVNFCRAEPYIATPLHERMADRDMLGGSYLGFDYRIEDDRTELLFRIAAAAFRQRNFATDGVHNRYMGLGYNVQLLQYFYAEHNPRRLARLSEVADELTCDIASETADLLEEALELARVIDLDDHDRVARETALLGLRVARADGVMQARLDAIYGELAKYSDAARQQNPDVTQPTSSFRRVLQRVAQSMALGALVAGGVTTMAACDDERPVPGDAKMESIVVDPAPVDAGRDFPVADPLPQDAGVDQRRDFPIADPAPSDASVDQRPDFPIADPAPSDASAHNMYQQSESPSQTLRAAVDVPIKKDLIDKWTDSSPRRAVRTSDLGLFDAPVVTLEADRDADGQAHVRLVGGPAAVTTRWQCEGRVEGEGREVLWVPESTSDHLTCAVRSDGGIAVVSLRAVDLPG